MNTLQDYCFEGNLAKVEEIMASDEPSIMEYIEYLGDSCLTEAVIDGHLDIAKVFLKDPRIKPHEFLLTFAAQGGYLDLLKFLIEDPRLNRSNQIRLAISKASIAGKAEAVRFLLGVPTLDVNEIELGPLLEVSEELSDKDAYNEILNVFLKDPRLALTIENDNALYRNGKILKLRAYA